MDSIAIPKGKYIQLDDSEGDEFEPKELRIVVCQADTNVVAALEVKFDPMTHELTTKLEAY